MRIVIFTQRVEEASAYKERRDSADQRIAAFIGACGFLGVPVPNDAEAAVRIAECVAPCGIMLTGGNSLVKYGGDAPERDAADRALIGWAGERDVPLYGFCRGMQSVLDYFGEALEDVEGHVAVRHAVSGSGRRGREVNSYHRQGCTELRTGEFEVLAEAGDGVIEAVRHRERRIAAAMWHPERESPFDAADIQFIRNLFL